MAVDLHTHSTASDGTDSPAEVAAAAADLGLTAVALTDHDTLGGIDEARRAAEVAAIELVPGVELSVDTGGVKLHLLVYFLEPGPGPLQDRLAALRHGREERNRRILGRLADLGYAVMMDEVLTHARGESVGRPHIADALVARGWFPDRTAVFAELLRDGGPAYEERLRLDAAEAIRLARAANAVPVVAHPYTTGLESAELVSLLGRLADVGLGGIEAYHPEHPPVLRQALARLAHGLGLAATGGSDHHGLGKPGVRIGIGKGDLVVPDEALAELLAQRERPSSAAR